MEREFKAFKEKIKQKRREGKFADQGVRRGSLRHGLGV